MRWFSQTFPCVGCVPCSLSPPGGGSHSLKNKNKKIVRGTGRRRKEGGRRKEEKGFMVFSQVKNILQDMTMNLTPIFIEIHLWWVSSFIVREKLVIVLWKIWVDYSSWFFLVKISISIFMDWINSSYSNYSFNII